MGAFEELAPFLQEYIYRNRWTELRDIQVAACDVLFHSERNLLLSSGTASGKTEAAFLPALTLLLREPSKSVGILYVAPLKALINDQFVRLEALLEECDLPVCKWHGDASATQKRRMMNRPRGVLQITPESLESLLMNHRAQAAGMFSDLRFVIIDEVHAFMGSPRGIQLLCQLQRIETLCGCKPRRIGLSATLKDLDSAAAWLCEGDARGCAAPQTAGVKKRIRPFMEWFDADEEPEDEAAEPGARKPATSNAYDQYLYEKTLNRQAILFANSRAEAERIVSHLKRLARARHSADCYRVHHGSVSATLREEVEREMKQDERPIVTAATLTLELGIDIGSLDIIVQMGAPFSVASLVQRMGRCGRRGQTAELLFPILAKRPLDPDGLDALHFGFLKAVAMLSLYLEEKWIEPATPPKLPYAIAYHQTLSVLYAQGELSAPRLAQSVLTLAPLRQISKADYVCLLRHMLETDQLAKTERGGLMLGEAGERVAQGYEFFSVFESPTEFIVQCGSEPIGTVMNELPVGECFALAGRAWEVVEVSESSHTLFVRETQRAAGGAWRSFFQVTLHERPVQKIREILRASNDYPYLSETCRARLRDMRAIAARLRITEQLVSPVGQATFAIFPWMGSGQLYALSHALADAGLRPVIGPDELTPLFLTVAAPASGGQEACRQFVLRTLRRIADGNAAISLPESAEIPAKYNEHIPKFLLNKQYETDFLDIDGMRKTLGARL